MFESVHVGLGVYPTDAYKHQSKSIGHPKNNFICARNPFPNPLSGNHFFQGQSRVIWRNLNRLKIRISALSWCAPVAASRAKKVGAKIEKYPPSRTEKKIEK